LARLMTRKTGIVRIRVAVMHLDLTMPQGATDPLNAYPLTQVETRRIAVTERLTQPTDLPILAKIETLRRLSERSEVAKANRLGQVKRGTRRKKVEVQGKTASEKRRSFSRAQT
jgi:hypothetical protein